MKYKLLFLTIFTGIFLNIKAQVQDSMWNNVTVSLLTCAPGQDEAYQSFGHTAIRVHHLQYNSDVVFNYGVFNFYDPDFYLKFTQGKLDYYLDIEPFNNFVQNYKEQNRWVREQVLQLSNSEKEQLVKALYDNAKEENRYYKYDFLFNNCSTQPRDLIFKVFAGKLDIHRYRPKEETFRDMIDRYMNYDEWMDLGIDLLLGLPTDKKASPKERMFLPVELMQAMDSATINNEPLVASSEEIVSSTPVKNKMKLGPAFWVWLILFLLILQQVRSKKLTQTRGIGFTYFFITGIIGCILVFMWFFTDHSTTQYNLNLLWAFPLHLPMSIFLLFRKIPPFAKTYFFTFRIIYLLMIIFWAIRPQDYHAAVFPMILIGIWCISKFHPIPKVLEQPE